MEKLPLPTGFTNVHRLVFNVGVLKLSVTGGPAPQRLAQQAITINRFEAELIIRLHRKRSSLRKPNLLLRMLRIVLSQDARAILGSAKLTTAIHMGLEGH
jgi:hypothetical protein